jgi:hypothetical protein
MFMGIVLQNDVGLIRFQRAWQIRRQGDLGHSLTVGTFDFCGVTIVPQKHVENDTIIPCITVMPMRRPSGRIQMDLDIASLPCASGKLNDSLLKIRTNLDIPTPRMMNDNLLSRKRLQYRRAPAPVKPQAAHQLFRYRTMEGHRRLREPEVAGLDGVQPM